MTPDFVVRDEGTIVLLTPVSDEGRAWAEAMVEPNAQYWGRSIVVEHRYIRDIADGIDADGLCVAWAH